MADFFGFNPAADFDHELHDDPGDGLDEDADDYDALNDETFGADSIGGDWEQSHEEMAQITEKSRVHRDSYNSTTDDRHTDEYLDGDDLGLDNLDLEASLSQLVDECDENIDEKTVHVKQQRGVISHRVMESGYSCSPPSEFNVWAVNKLDQAQQLDNTTRQQPPLPLPTAKILKVHTLEELERDLLSKPNPAILRKPPAPPAALRLEDLERDLTAATHKFPPGFPPRGHPPPFAHHPPHMQDIVPHNNGVPPPGYPHHIPHQGMRTTTGNAAFGQLLLPTQLQPGLLDYRQHGHRHMGPNMLRFMPPHPMMGNHQYQPHRNNMNFRPPYPMPPMMDPRNYPPNMRPPYPRPPCPRFPPGRDPRMNGYHRDEYDGLMSNREVQWLLNIQLLQLNTSQPFKDDFYYTVYQSRKPKNRSESRNGRERRDSNRDNRPESQLGQQQQRTYTPLQFENSLGKLQCGSVTAPRKIIDMDIVSEPADPTQNIQKDSRRTKQLLLQLEQLYLILMQVEDSENPLAEMGDVDKVPLVHKIITTLLAEDRLQATLCVGKGKNLVLRLLPHLTGADHVTHLLSLWCCLLKNLILIGRRDSESNLLPRFWPYMQRWLRNASLEQLHQLIAGLRVTSPYPPSRNLLVYALTHKLGVSALSSIISRAESLFPSADSTLHQDWSLFIHDLHEAASLVTPDSFVTSNTEVESSIIIKHLARFDGVKTDSGLPLVDLLTGHVGEKGN